MNCFSHIIKNVFEFSKIKFQEGIANPIDSHIVLFLDENLFFEMANSFYDDLNNEIENELFI